MPIASVDTNFVQHVTNLAVTSKAASDGTLQAAQRLWNQPGVANALWDGDPSNIQGMANAFDRTNINDMAVLTMTTGGAPDNSGGRLSDLMGSYFQLHYLAAEQRAFSSMNSSKIRSAYHAAARRAGHGDPAGLFKNNILQYAQQLIACGYTGGATGIT